MRSSQTCLSEFGLRLGKIYLEKCSGIFQQIDFHWYNIEEKISSFLDRKKKEEIFRAPGDFDGRHVFLEQRICVLYEVWIRCQLIADPAGVSAGL